MLANMTISIFWLPIIILAAVLTGFFFRGAQIMKSKKRIIYLENEMLSNHAEILKLQQNLVELEKKQDLSFRSRVVPMKDSSPENAENSDSAQRKKINK